MGIVVTPQQVETRLAQIKKQYFSGSEAKYKAQLKKVNLTDAQVREDMRQQLIAEARLRSSSPRASTVPQKDIDAYYKAHARSTRSPQSRDVRYILVGK